MDLVLQSITKDVGTGLVKPFIFNIPTWGTINIHRGCIDSYRGLDSDLWSLYNKEFDKIDVTVHYIDEKLDTGDILLKKNLCLDKVDNIYELKYHTTILATKMVIEILNKFSLQNKRISGLKQVKLGKYFSVFSRDITESTLSLRVLLQVSSNRSGLSGSS